MPLIEGLAGPHLVRYGTTADQKFLLHEFLTTYDQLVINAKIVAHMPAALASLLTHRMQGKPFLIDPQTHAFQHSLTHLDSLKTGKMSRSITKLIEAYGEPVKTSLLNRGEVLVPSDFDSSAKVTNFCSSVLDFQEKTLRVEVDLSDSAKYYKFLKDEGRSMGSEAVRPSMLIAPYFFLESRKADEWLEVNTSLAKAAIVESAARRLPVGVEIVLSADVLADDELRNRIILSYGKLRPAAFLFWISDFSEEKASRAQLKRLVELVNGLASNTPVVSLYGGYFSVALMTTKRAPLAGVTHGLEYGESRDVVPVVGGIPVAKFYLPATHSRLVMREAVRAISALGGFKSRDAYLSNVCKCVECQNVISASPDTSFEDYGRVTAKPVRGRNGMVSREFPTQETKSHCVRHYMWAKKLEFSAVSTAAAAAAALRAQSAKLQRVIPESASHCEVWADVLDA